LTPAVTWFMFALNQSSWHLPLQLFDSGHTAFGFARIVGVKLELINDVASDEAKRPEVLSLFRVAADEAQRGRDSDVALRETSSESKRQLIEHLRTWFDRLKERDFHEHKVPQIVGITVFDRKGAELASYGDSGTDSTDGSAGYPPEFDTS